MVIHFDKTLQDALQNIGQYHYKGFPIHQQDIRTSHHSHLIKTYGEAKWAIVDAVNTRYSAMLEKPFDLINWLHHNQEDELSYFLSEAGSNSLHHSSLGAPACFHLWMGENGFVVGVQQNGDGFNAEQVSSQRIMDNKGAAFTFFRNCQGSVFFDDSSNAKVVYFEKLF